MRWLLLLKRICFLCCQCLLTLVFFNSIVIPIVFNTISLIFTIILGERNIFPKSTHTHGENFLCLLTQTKAEGRQFAALTHSNSNGFILSAFWFFSLAEWINYLYTLKWLLADAVNYFICHHYNHIIPFKECWKMRFVLLLREKHERERTAQ